jgi:uncharacterized membrane protein
MAEANARLEAFSDGVFAIALTLLIIDIKIPSADRIGSTSELWRALRHLAPSVFAFLLSFGIILICWVNHHGALKLVKRSSGSFIFANGLLLLTIVFIPFPTSLLGEFLRTDHAAPAVVLYNAVLAVQALSWILVSGAALRNHLVRDEQAILVIRENHRNAYGAFVLYSLLAATAFRFPITSAIVTTASMVFWLTVGIRMKHE